MPWQATIKFNGETQFRHTSLTLRGVLEALPPMTMRWLDQLPDNVDSEAFTVELLRVPPKGGR